MNKFAVLFLFLFISGVFAQSVCAKGIVIYPGFESTGLELFYSGDITVPISLDIKDRDSPSCVFFELKYNPDMFKLEDIKINNQALKDKKLRFRVLEPGHARVVVYGYNKTPIESGDVARAYFHCESSYMQGAAYFAVSKAMGCTGDGAGLPMQGGDKKIDLTRTPQPLDSANDSKCYFGNTLFLAGAAAKTMFRKKICCSNYLSVLDYYGAMLLDGVKIRGRPPPFIIFNIFALFGLMMLLYARRFRFNPASLKRTNQLLIIFLVFFTGFNLEGKMVTVPILPRCERY